MLRITLGRNTQQDHCCQVHTVGSLQSGMYSSIYLVRCVQQDHCSQVYTVGLLQSGMYSWLTLVSYLKQDLFSQVCTIGSLQSGRNSRITLVRYAGVGMYSRFNLVRNAQQHHCSQVFTLAHLVQQNSDDFGWETIFDERQPLMEYDHHCKTNFHFYTFIRSFSLIVSLVGLQCQPCKKCVGGRVSEINIF